MEKTDTKWRKQTQNGENRHKMEKTDTKSSKQTQNGENRHKTEKKDTKWRKQTQNGDKYQPNLHLEALGNFRPQHSDSP